MKKVKCINARRSYPELIEGNIYEFVRETQNHYWTKDKVGYLKERFEDEEVPLLIYNLNTPKHYNNSKGTLYKVAQERGWNSYLFDIVKRLERAEKKGEFETDLEKSIDVIKLWMREQKNASGVTK